MTISISLLTVLTSTTLFIWLKVSYNKLSHATRVLLTLCTCVSVYFFVFLVPHIGCMYWREENWWKILIHEAVVTDVSVTCSNK